MPLVFGGREQIMRQKGRELKKCRTSAETHNLRGGGREGWGMKGKGKRRASGERHEKVGAACSGLSPT